ncbi:MAG TPA: hypothetical protein VGM53_28270 [Streptosporangiaceae bacterium]
MKRIEYRKTFFFPLPPAELWTIMERFDLFEAWWVWLTDFRADQPTFTGGNVLRAVVAPPALRRLHVDARLRRCAKPALIEGEIEGDLSGPAALRLTESTGGTLVEATWSLTLRSPPLRAAAYVAGPLMRSGHDHLIDLAVSRFRSKALSLACAAIPAEPDL